MLVVVVVVKCCVLSVKVCKYICGDIVIKKCVHVCVGDVCVGSSVRCSDEEGTVLCVQLHRQEVPEPPLRDKFVAECMFNENGNAVIRCFCSVPCGVTVVFDGCVCCACAVE